LEKIAELLSEVVKKPTKNGLLAPWINTDTKTIRVVARIKMTEPHRFAQLAQDLYGFQQSLSDYFDVKLTGWPLIFKNLEQKMIVEWMQSFFFAFAVVWCLLYFAFRSVRWWCLALLPNIFPLIITLGAIGYLHVGLNFDLLMIPGVALGLVVDDTIHFIYRLKEDWQKKIPLKEALKKTFQQTGTPLCMTSIVLIAGFSTLFFSSLRVGFWLASTMIAVIFFALLANLIVLPALLTSFSTRLKPKLKN